MKLKKKIVLIVLLLLGVGLLVGFLVTQGSRSVVAVQFGTARTEDLTAVVTASGEIKPKTYVNFGANAFVKTVKLYVKEGDRVKSGQLLAQLENVQSAADVAAQRAGVEASRTDADAAQANYARTKADAEQKRQDYVRAEGLFKQGLIAQSEYDLRKAAWESSAAMLAQAKAQQESAGGRVTQAKATLTSMSDRLSKTTYLAPFDGVVTNLPVREGETVVVGIQNSPGSTLMTIADLGVITAEVKADETDIVNIKLGQTAEVSIDAIPKQTFKGVVTEIGNNAMLRSTGVATTQTTTGSQEAKDFKV